MYFCIMVSLHVHSSGLVSAIENVHGNTIDRILMPNRDLGPRTDQACSSLGGDTTHWIWIRGDYKKKIQILRNKQTKTKEHLLSTIVSEGTLVVVMVVMVVMVVVEESRVRLLTIADNAKVGWVSIEAHFPAWLNIWVAMLFTIQDAGHITHGSFKSIIRNEKSQ